MKEYDFIKYEGCGNDYIYIDCFDREIAEDEKTALAVRLSDRHFGVGGDGVVYICRSRVADGMMRMFNADGSEGKMCGNAVRCVGKYLYEKRGIRRADVRVETLSGIKTLALKIDGGVVTGATVDMGAPALDPRLIPALVPGERAVNVRLSLDRERTVTLVSMGNPHCVTFLSSAEEVERADIETPGRIIERHETFPERINVEFAALCGDGSVRMRVWERGSGETLACGTGACATAVACVLGGLKKPGEDVRIKLTGGELTINYDGKRVLMTGPATEVFTGRVKV